MSALLVQDGSNQDDYCIETSIDGAGNVFVAGITDGDFGGAPSGSNDVFVCKYDGSGNELWRRQIGTSADDDAYGLTTDSAGNVFVCGQTKGVLASPNGGFYDAFLVKLDGDGATVWTRQFGTTSNDGASSVVADDDGNTYLCGWTLDSFGGPNLGNYDCFIVKFDHAGEQVWARQFGTFEDDGSSDISLDASGNILVTGGTLGSFGAPILGETDAFLVKFDPAGDVLWKRQFGSTSYDTVSALAVDAVGNAYVVGSTLGDIGGSNLGHYDAFCTKVGWDGMILWTRHHGTSLWDIANDVGVDALGYVYVAIRWYHGSFTFFAADARTIKYSPDGATLWLETVSTGDSEVWQSVGVDDLGRVWLAGATDGMLGPSPGGESDLLVVRYDPKACYPDCDDSSSLDFLDLLCFHGALSVGNFYADCNEDGELDFFDFLCFQNLFAGGCP